MVDVAASSGLGVKLAPVGSGASPDSRVYFNKILTKRVGPLRIFFRRGPRGVQNNYGTIERANDQNLCTIQCANDRKSGTV